MNTDTKQINSVSAATSSEAPPPTGLLEPITCWVGLDWADKKHCLTVRTSVTATPQTHFVEHKPDALDAWFLQLRQDHPTGCIAVAIEQSRGPVLYALMKYDFLRIYPVNPRCLSDYRRAFKISGAKDDPLDANLLCELVCCHADRLRPLVVEEPIMRKLRLLVEARRGFVQDRTRCTNRLEAALKCYYSLALELVGDNLALPMALDLLRRWPNLDKLQAAKPGTLRTFFYAHNSRSEDRIQERLQAIQAAKPLTQDPALISPLQLQMEQLVEQVRALNRTIALYDTQIKATFSQFSEAWIFEALPGAGPALAPRLAAVFGTIRTNFPKAQDVIKFTGVAPVRKQSGTQDVVQFRYARPIFCHQSVVEFAKCSLKQCGWARLLYEDQLRQGKTKWAAIRKVAFKWLRILWRCWQERTAYNETLYLQSLQRDGVELFRSLYQDLSPVPTTIVNNS